MLIASESAEGCEAHLLIWWKPEVCCINASDMNLISGRDVQSKTSYVAESSSWRSAVRWAKEEKSAKHTKVS